MKEGSTVFVIDDDDSVRKSLSRLLRSLGFGVETFASAEQFLDRENYRGIGCIVLDLQMPGLSGIDLQDRLSRTGNNLPIVFVTGHATVPTSVRALKAGAEDYLEKPFEDHELLEAVSRAIQKHSRQRHAQKEIKDLRARLQILTPREREVFRLVASGMLNKQVAFELGITEKTVKVHRARVMQKMGARSLADLVRFSEKLEIRSEAV
jgi:RNA polymerase sigma factor (sigma-70 family)